MDCKLKIINQIVKTRIENYIQDKKILPNNCYGFRKGKSTTECLNDIIGGIKSDITNWDYVAVIFMDIDKAFDSVDYEELGKTLIKLEIPRKISAYILHYLEEKTMIIKTNKNEIITKKSNKGLLQGCPLSPTLFNLYTKEAHEILDSEIFQIFQYADDFAIKIRGKNDLNYNTKINLEIQ